MSDYTLRYNDSFGREIDLCTIQTVRTIYNEHGLGVLIRHLQSGAYFVIQSDGMYYEVIYADEFGARVHDAPVTWGHPTMNSCVETLAEMIVEVERQELWAIAQFN